MIQSTINIIYRYPKAQLKKYKRFGGYLKYLKMIQARNRMAKYSSTLPPIQSYKEGLKIYFLTGQKYFFQTLYCIHSLARSSREKFQFILVDDGSFNDRLKKRMNRQLPGALIIDKKEIENNLSRMLPEGQYPILHSKRKEYPHIRKLVDIHTCDESSWKLVLDSDMLFWKNPVEMTEWLKDPLRPIYMLDCIESYGYSTELMESLCKTKIPELVNVGIIGLNSEFISWMHVEEWIQKLENIEGKSYFLEQAVSAMLIGESHCQILNGSEYIANPADIVLRNSSGTVHHYVDLSKAGYYQTSLPKIFCK